MEAIPIWVINLKERRDRWNFILKSLSLSKIPLQNVHRYDAVNSFNISPNELSTLLSKRAFNTLFSNLNYRTDHSQLTLGSIGCYLSHVNLWKQLLDSEHSHFLIFEDDCKLSEDSLDSLNYVLKNIPKSFDFLFLGSVIPPTSDIVNDKNVILNKFVRLHTVYGLHGYVISKEAVKKLLPSVLPIEYQLDSFISYNKSILNMYVMIPNIAYQSGSITDIQNSCRNCGPLVQIYEVNGKQLHIKYVDKFIPYFFYYIIPIGILLWGIRRWSSKR